MHFRYESNGVVNEIVLERQGEHYLAHVGGVPLNVEVLSAQPGELNLRVDGKPLRLYWANDGDHKWVAFDGCTYRLDRPGARAGRGGDKSAEGRLRAPMPAQVRAIQVAEGDPVEKGQTLLLLEAMKMEIRLAAPRQGTVRRILAQPGETVSKDQVLVELE